MNDIFNNQIKEVLEYAQKLKMVGEVELSKELCIKIVRKVSDYHGVDLIELFYGEQAYERITDAVDAAKYIFISKCAMKVYDVIAPCGAASSPSSGWAIADNANSNEKMKYFFTWLQKPNRMVETEDCTYFKMILNTMSGFDNLHFKMSNRVRQFTLIDIIRMLVSGTLTITSNGELL